MILFWVVEHQGFDLIRHGQYLLIWLVGWGFVTDWTFLVMKSCTKEIDIGLDNP